jgi:hypothetical protein
VQKPALAVDDEPCFESAHAIDKMQALRHVNASRLDGLPIGWRRFDIHENIFICPIIDGLQRCLRTVVHFPWIDADLI